MPSPHPTPKPHPNGRYWLQLLKRRRTTPPPMPGDFFVCCTPDHKWLSGRVVFDHISGADPTAPPVGIELVLYVYKGLHNSIDEVPLPPRKPELLIPPGFYNQTLWTQGIIYTIGNWKLKKSELLKRHIFRYYENVLLNPEDEWSTSVCRYRDENFRDTTKPRGPTSVWGIAPASCFSAEIQEALGPK